MINFKTFTIHFVSAALFLAAANKYYFSGSDCHSPDRIDGKVVIVTGANTGIGKETVLDLTRRGGKVYMACRSREKCEIAAEDIIKKTKAAEKNLITMELDLASMASIRNFVDHFQKKEKALHILVNNAGIMAIRDRQETEDGFELTVGVNHLGHFLLTNLLIKQLLEAAPSRVVTVSSRAHTRAQIDLDDLMLKREDAYRLKGFLAYSYSKSANVLFSRELGRRLNGTGVTTYSLHPGTVLTELARNIYIIGDHPLILNSINLILKAFMKTPTQGAQTQICCAVDQTLAKETGKYYADCQETEAADWATQDINSKHLWNLSLKLVQLKKSEVHPLLR